MTREERNVLVFVAIGLLLGSVPDRAPRPEAIPPAGAPDTAAAPFVERSLYPIDVNRADAALLEQLPGIGPQKAAAIVACREQGGPFRTIEELERVTGIGPRTVDRLRELVTTGESGSGTGHAGETDNLVGTSGNAAAGEPDPLAGAARAGPEAAEVER